MHKVHTNKYRVGSRRGVEKATIAHTKEGSITVRERRSSMSNGAAVRASAYDAVMVNDDSHHHHLPATKLGNIYGGHHQLYPVRQLIYTMSLLLALGIIQRATDAAIFDAVQKHEPSIRIFRALVEVVVLLVCCAASIAVWTCYLTVPVTASLLFSPVESPLTWTMTNTARAVVEEEEGDALFKDVQEDDLFVENKIVDSKEAVANKEKEMDDGDFELEKSSKPDQLEAEPDDYDEASPDGTAASMIPSPLAVLSAALDLLVWILVTLVLYTVTAIHAVNLQPSDDSNHVVNFLARIAAPTFPLLLFCFCAVKAVYPWKLRSKLITIVSYTISAPWYEVTFRDGMIVSFVVLLDRVIVFEIAQSLVSSHGSISTLFSFRAHRVMCSLQWCVPCRTLPLQSATFSLDCEDGGPTITSFPNRRKWNESL